MSSAFLSPSWYRVAQLAPRLHPHVHIHRQRLRGQAWYVLQDRGAGKVHRFTPATCALLARMDGQRTVDALWRELAGELGDDAPSQDEVIELLHQLHAADLLQSGVPPDLDEMGERRRKAARAKWMQAVMNPLSIRIPVWDPAAFLDDTWPALRRIGPVLPALLWLLAVVSATVLAFMHWGELTANMADRVLALENLFLLWLTYPLVKLCHELGHAYAVRSGGGEVHEMGLMFLVFAPVPYVDASAANAFRSKWRRMLVGAAGMLVELFLAALALFVWLAAEPGVVRAVAFNIMLIGGFATVLFNGNPLLRFDGYYILADAIEIPNLAQRSTRWWGYLARRFLLGARDAESPAHTRGERAWFALYAPVSWLYRLVITLGIAFFVMREYFFIGVLIGLWSLGTTLAVPLFKIVRFVLTSAELDPHRLRANVVGFGGVALLAALAFAVPLPAWTSAEGVVWVPDNAEVRAGTSGFVQRVLVAPGASVAPGDALVELADPELAAETAASAARVEQLTVQLASEVFSDRVKAELTRQQLEAERTLLARLQRREDALVVRAGAAGRWVVPSAADLPGRYFAQGALVGHAVAGATRTIRAVVPQDDVDLVRARTRAVEAVLADRPLHAFAARIVREVPGGSDKLPSKALTLDGGGAQATDPRDPEGLRTLNRTFQFDLELQAADAAIADLRFGTRAYLKFRQDAEPLALQAWRRLRQLFLGQLHV